MTELTNAAIADVYRASHETFDFSAVAQLIDPDMRTWRSHDNAWMSVAEIVAHNEGGGPRTHIASSSPPKTTVTESGFILQQTIERPPLGTVHIIQVVTVKDGRITSCEQYMAPEMELPPLPA